MRFGQLARGLAGRDLMAIVSPKRLTSLRLSSGPVLCSTSASIEGRPSRWVPLRLLDRELPFVWPKTLTWI